MLELKQRAINRSKEPLPSTGGRGCLGGRPRGLGAAPVKDGATTFLGFRPRLEGGATSSFFTSNASAAVGFDEVTSASSTIESIDVELIDDATMLAKPMAAA